MQADIFVCLGCDILPYPASSQRLREKKFQNITSVVARTFVSMYHSSPTRRSPSHIIASFSPKPMTESVTKMIS